MISYLLRRPIGLITEELYMILTLRKEAHSPCCGFRSLRAHCQDLPDTDAPHLRPRTLRPLLNPGSGHVSPSRLHTLCHVSTECVALRFEPLLQNTDSLDAELRSLRHRESQLLLIPSDQKTGAADRACVDRSCQESNALGTHAE